MPGYEAIVAPSMMDEVLGFAYFYKVIAIQNKKEENGFSPYAQVVASCTTKFFDDLAHDTCASEVSPEWNLNDVDILKLYELEPDADHLARCTRTVAFYPDLDLKVEI